ncbi:MAG: transglycosylase SLT domain-containing protein [Candidatus Aminicenantes bacterium]|nr:transglycosylase SLT domain-containing protein [Candidatus Aminicenantes bacterium]
MFRYIGIVSILALLAGCSKPPKPNIVPRIDPTTGKTVSQTELKPASTADIPKDAAKESPKTIIPPEEKKAAAETGIEDTNSPTKGGAAASLEEALDAYTEAKTCREGGDLDGSLKALDRAYALMLKAEVPADSPLLQEKNDLRILIAQRVQEIYACQANPAGTGGKAIPLIENKWVLDEIKSFQTVERGSFLEAYKRSGLYRELIAAEFRKAGLPEELSWLPVIESGYMTRALSKARALGLWQFIASTGYRYGLSRDQWVDERMDPEKATRAAIKHLNDLHTAFGDWATALAAYNCGEWGVQRVINTQHINYLDDFWDLFTRLPFETARFVPRFIAVVLITQNPEKYGIALPATYAPAKYDTVSVAKPAKLSVLSTALGLEATELAFLNPELRLDSTPDKAYELKVPAGYGDRTQQAIAAIPKYVPPEASFSYHVIRSGDTLWSIAQKYRTSLDMVIKLNGITRNALLLPGKRLKVPGKGGLAAN